MRKMELKEDEKELDARGVLADFMEFRNSSDESSESTRGAFARRLTTGIWLFGIVVVIVNYFVVTKDLVIPDGYVLVYFLVLVGSVVAMTVCLYLDIVKSDFKSFLKDPTSEVLMWSDQGLEKEILLYEKFDEYPLDALVQTKNFLLRKKTLIESLSSMLVGVLTKVGILPAVLATLIIILKLNGEVGLSPVSWVGILLIGIYFVCFRLIEASVKFDEFQSIFSDYIEVRKNKGK